MHCNSWLERIFLPSINNWWLVSTLPEVGMLSDGSVRQLKVLPRLRVSLIGSFLTVLMEYNWICWRRECKVGSGSIPVWLRSVQLLSVNRTILLPRLSEALTARKFCSHRSRASRPLLSTRKPLVTEINVAQESHRCLMSQCRNVLAKIFVSKQLCNTDKPLITSVFGTDVLSTVSQQYLFDSVTSRIDTKISPLWLWR